MRFRKALVSVAVIFSTLVSALPSVTRTGRCLYQADGTRFFVKGVAYQQQGDIVYNNGFPEPTDFTDPLADSTGCARDLPYFTQLGINAIHVYSVNSSLNHDNCMQALSKANIYVILDLSLPNGGSIDRSSPSYTTNLLNQYLETIDTFLNYDNILAFNVGNEVVSFANETMAAPFIKAIARDVKAYLKSKGSSALVGYASDDGAAWLPLFADYLACDSDATSIDIFGLNNYRGCPEPSVSDYSDLITDFANYSIPTYFSEFGCNRTYNSKWTEVQTLFGDPQVTPIWSGAVAFTYFGPTVQDFGLVTLSSDNTTVTPGPDFLALQQQYNQVKFVATPSLSDAGANTQATCPSADGTNFLGSSKLPPTPVNTPCACLQSNFYNCRFTNGNSPNAAAIIGDLIGEACSAISGKGGSCSAIASDGTTGTYGPFSMCDPETKLSYVLSKYYQLANGQGSGACSWGGNGTFVSSGPSSTAAANAVESSCAAQAFTGTTLPGAPTATPTGTTLPGTPTGGPDKSSNSKSNASAALDARGVFLTLALGLLGTVGGIALVL